MDSENKSGIITIDQVLPQKINIIPIMRNPVFPGMIFPLHVTNEFLDNNFSEMLKDLAHLGIILFKRDDIDLASFTEEDFYTMGTVGKVLKIINLPDGSRNIFLNPVKRMRIVKVLDVKKIITAAVEYPDETLKIDNEIKAMMRNLLADIKELISDNPFFSEEMKLGMVNIEEPGKICDFITSLLNIESRLKQEVLEELDIKKRLQKVSYLLIKEKDITRLQKKIQLNINEKITKQQRDFFLREELKQIKKELGMETDPKSGDYDNFKKKLDSFNLTGEPKEKAYQELEKFKLMEPASSEYFVVRKYLETICSLPWVHEKRSMHTLERAEKILNQDHYGLEEVKKRILEFIAVQIFKNENKGSIICLVGPPGVGKTSVGKSIARAMNREFFRFSVGGMRDEAEIKGHRRTYIGAMPGKIIQALSTVKTKNTVLMLDEIDKMGASYHGDPASALLEVLDPEQNCDFRDHYLDLPFDLSGILFVTTANTLDSIPPALLDRMEVIRLSGYIEEEKIQIGKKYLVPKSIKKHGLEKSGVAFSTPAFREILRYYSREAGVRNFEKNIDKICRHITYEKVKASAAENAELDKNTPLTVGENEVKSYLGVRTFPEEKAAKIIKPGMSVGLAWTALGGEVLVIESALSSPKGDLKLTGQLGNVMQESANIAFSYIKNLFSEYKIAPSILENQHIHLHVPAGATPKDGPSAGITMAVSMLSLLRSKKMKEHIAMTGELSLVGNVLPIGGLKEKVIAAKRNKMKKIIFPADNEKDLKEIPAYIKKGITFHPVQRAEEVFRLVF